MVREGDNGGGSDGWEPGRTDEADGGRKEEMERGL